MKNRHTSSRAQRRLVRLAPVTLLALFLSACSGTPEATPTEETGPVEILLATPAYAGGDTNPYEPLMAAFTQENPNITIKLVETPNDQHGQTIRTQLQAGNAPDIFYVTAGRGINQSFGSLADAGYLEELTGQQWAADTVPDSARSLYFEDNKLYAMPVDLAPLGQITNIGALRDLGVGPATTFREVLDQCKLASAAGKSLYGLAGASAANNGMHAMQIAASTVYAQDPDWDAKRDKGEAKFVGSDWQVVLERILQLKSADCYQDGVAGAGMDQLFPAVAQGKVTAAFTPAGAVAALRAQVTTGEFDVSIFPGNEAGDSRLLATPVNALAVNAAGKHKTSALKFLEFLAKPSSQDELAKLNGNVAMTAALSGSIPAQFPTLESYFKDESRIIAQPNLVWPNSGVFDALGTGVQGLLTGQATPEQVLKAMDDAYDRGE
ncbi:ABC transporter substrate-binding protein [Paenarthrobacter sp. NPDC091711]|uniref:ABC transporter substrate-binding protein n=1 Tax=Paenarthrobacter sp. NPDC091711 TaxID=3364385 RepID=UPI00381470C8